MEQAEIIDTFGTYQHPQAFLLVLEYVNDNKDNLCGDMLPTKI